MADIDLIALKREITEFLDNRDANSYGHKVSDMVKDDQGRLLVDLGDLRNYSPDLVNRLLGRPHDVVPVFEDALRDHLSNLDPKFLVRHPTPRVGFTGPFGWRRCTPRELLSDRLSQLVRVDGIVTKCSLVRPKLAKAVHYSKATGKFLTRRFGDVTNLTSNAGGAISMLKKDEGNNPVDVEYGQCEYHDHQTIVLQEAPESAPAGQLPRSVEVILEDDLVDACKPGDRVSVSGVYRAAGRRARGAETGIMRAVIVANAVVVGRKGDAGAMPRMTGRDIKNIQAVAAGDEAPLDVLARSLAPSIYGHDRVKKALVLQLVGGTEKVLENGTHLRGDINVLLVGDPGVAKSQLLRAVMNVAPLAVSTTGRGSSGVGLTAAVTADSETGERRLEAGAMVLADRGVVCIDEFDKMNDSDRVAIHEVMEQQTVTIAKAGIYAMLNARCAVLAAANPLYGTYEPSLSVTRNINLPDSLLSRFDVLFVLLDAKDQALDLAVASHVLRMHGAAPAPALAPYEADRAQEGPDRSSPSDEQVWMRFDRGAGAAGRVLTTPFLRKYLAYARAKFNPQLSDEACDRISERWTEMRQASLRATSASAAALPITARTLETLIRLSTAHARVRQSDVIEAVDVAGAESVLDLAMYRVQADEQGGAREDEGRGGRGGRKQGRRGNGGGDSDSDSSEDEGEGEEGGRGLAAGRGRRGVAPRQGVAQAQDAAGRAARAAARAADRDPTPATPATDAAGPAAQATSAPATPAPVPSVTAAPPAPATPAAPATVDAAADDDADFGLPPAPGADFAERYAWDNRRGRNLTSEEEGVLAEVLSEQMRVYMAGDGDGVRVADVVAAVMAACGGPGTGLTETAVRRALVAYHVRHQWLLSESDDTMYPSF